MAYKLPPDIWVVVPAYNEHKYIGTVLEKIKVFTDKVIVVDDGSLDDTDTVAQKHVRYVLRHRINLGKGAALKTGCDFAFSELDARAVILLDADDQHDPQALKLFIDSLDKGFDLVLGVRNFDLDMPVGKKLGNLFASKLVKILFGTYIPDIPSGYKAFTKQGYDQIAWESTGYGVELEIAINTAATHLPFVVVPIKTIYHDLDKGMTTIDTVAMLIQIILFKLHL